MQLAHGGDGPCEINSATVPALTLHERDFPEPASSLRCCPDTTKPPRLSLTSLLLLASALPIVARAEAPLCISRPCCQLFSRAGVATHVDRGTDTRTIFTARPPPRSHHVPPTGTVWSKRGTHGARALSAYAHAQITSAGPLTPTARARSVRGAVIAAFFTLFTLATVYLNGKRMN